MIHPAILLLAFVFGVFAISISLTRQDEIDEARHCWAEAQEWTSHPTVSDLALFHSNRITPRRQMILIEEGIVDSATLEAFFDTARIYSIAHHGPYHNPAAGHVTIGDM